jgi:hypothetical protein
VREFRTAPATRSAKTKASDGALERLAKRFGLSDMSNRSGSVGGSRAQPRDFSPVWGKMPKEGGIDAALSSVAVPIGGKERVMDMRSKDAGVAELEKTLGKTPSFMEVAKTLHRPRPNPQGREPGNAGDLAKAIERAP